MTKPTPPPLSVDPECPDGPEPHPFPAWPYALERALPLPDGLPGADSAAAEAVPSATDAIKTWRRMALAPYTAIWSAYAQGFQTWATLWDVRGPGDGGAPSAGDPGPAPH